MGVDESELETGVLRDRPGVELAIGAAVAGVSMWMLETMLAAPAGRARQMGLGVGILLGVMGLGGMATAVARQYEEAFEK